MKTIVFKAMTRPPMIAGVSYNLLPFVALPAIVGMATVSILYLFIIGAPLFLIARLACMWDPYCGNYLILALKTSYQTNRWASLSKYKASYTSVVPQRNVMYEKASRI